MISDVTLQYWTQPTGLGPLVARHAEARWYPYMVSPPWPVVDKRQVVLILEQLNPSSLQTHLPTADYTPASSRLYLTMGSSASFLAKIEFSPLVPQSPPLGVMPMYAQNKELTLKLREKKMSFSGDSFEITDLLGQPHFKMEGNAWNFRNKKSKLAPGYFPVIDY